MSENYCGLFNGLVKQDYCDKANAIAGKYDYHIVCYDDPARGPRGWFAGPNLGSPFDAANSKAVLDDLEAAGLWPPHIEESE